MKVFVLLVCVAVAAAKKFEPSCEGNPEPGFCMAYMPRWYYNAEEDKCEEFIYGGCGGNGNRYKSEEECLKQCKKQSADVDVCSLKSESGPCRAFIPRYFFDGKECKEFIYGGCKGNGNNFKSQDECHSTCLKKDEDLQELCNMPHETGPCRAYFERYYYDSIDGTCKKFVYGGCQGNGNNFRTEDSCYDKCSGIKPYMKKRSAEVCSFLPETGLCKAYIPRFYYDEASNDCKEFIYGGCGGNGNNFVTKEDCHSKCGKQRGVEVCSLEHEVGPCRAAFERFYFDAKTGECKEFIYGGCAGNANNFVTLEECHNTCSGC